MSETNTSETFTLNSKVTALDRYKKYLQIVSLLMKKPLTDLEITILDEFYHASYGVITTESRRTVRENVNLSSENLNNYILKLRKRKVIIDDRINPNLLIAIPETETFDIHLKLAIIT